MRNLIAGLAATMISVGAVSAQVESDEDEKLVIGDKAPRLEHVEWLQGGPVSSWESGHVYVLDFWATWCGPCVAAIPHMNEMYKEHSADNVHVVGLAIWPSESMTPTDEFVADKGSKMAYTIGSDIDGKTAEKFMKAAGQNGIPTVMIVNQEGVLAWIGHPMSGMDDALEAIVAGEYNVKEAAAKHRRRVEGQAKTQKLYRAFAKADEAGDWDKAIDAIDKLVEIDEDRYASLLVEKYRIMVLGMEKSESAGRFGRDLVKSHMWDNTDMLNAMAWTIVDPDGEFDEDHQDLDLAMMAAKRGNEISEGENAFILDTLARVYYRMGNIEKAIHYQRKAVKHSEGPMKAELSKALKEYEEAMSTF